MIAEERANNAVSMDLEGKVVIVTGASSGIGQATAKVLARKGARVALVSRSREKLERLSAILPGSYAVPADMSKIPEVERMIEETMSHYRRIDVLINCAGQGYDAPVEKTNIDTLRYIFDLDFVGPLVAMEKVIPVMRKQRGGTIVNVSSGTALMYLPYNGAYSSLKQALASLSLTARMELKKDNIVVSVMYPYMTATSFEDNTIKDSVPESEDEGGGPPFPLDTALYAAEKIVEGIESGEAEIFSHNWMKNRPTENL
jgi:short-subunit dehydrogenase